MDKISATAYPNPTAGIVTIEFNAEENTDLTVNDVTGKELDRLHLQSADGTVQLDLSSFQSGIYFVPLSNKNVRESNRAVKHKSMHKQTKQVFQRAAVLSAALFLLFTFSSCEKIDNLTKFDIDYSYDVTIPGTFGILIPFNVLSQEIATNSEFEFELNSTRKDLVEEILLQQLRLTIQRPKAQTFSFLREIRLFIKSDGLAEKMIAERTGIQDDAGTQITLDTSAEDLKDYIKKDKFTIRVNAVADESVANDVVIEAFSRFQVDAKTLGI